MEAATCFLHALGDAASRLTQVSLWLLVRPASAFYSQGLTATLHSGYTPCPPALSKMQIMCTAAREYGNDTQDNCATSVL